MPFVQFPQSVRSPRKTATVQLSVLFPVPLFECRAKLHRGDNDLSVARKPICHYIRTARRIYYFSAASGLPEKYASIPLNVHGGYRWPNAAPVDRDVLRKVVRAELGST